MVQIKAAKPSDYKDKKFKAELELMAKTLTAKEIAGVLDISDSWMWKILKHHGIKAKGRTKVQRSNDAKKANKAKNKNYMLQLELREQEMMPLSAFLSKECRDIARGLWV